MSFYLEIVLLVFFGLSTFYVLFFSVSGLFYRAKKCSETTTEASSTNFAILIPAYKEDGVIVSVSKSMLELEYPKSHYDVFVIADQLQPETITALKELDINVVEVEFEKSTKTKSLNYCLSQMDTAKYEMVLISDADNVLAKDFLLKVHEQFITGSNAIQGRRVAKNLNTDYAVLDGASEIINNHIFRKGPNAIGLSASLIGSGMAFKTQEVIDCLNEITAVGGFDKVLQLKILEKGNRISYVQDALVFDEKVDNPDNFKNQRKRWLSSQYKYLIKYFGKGLIQLSKGNIDYFNIAILHNLFLPRVITLGSLFIIALFSLLTFSFIGFNYIYWITLFIVYCFSLGIALPKKFYGRKLIKSIFSLPGAFFSMFLLLFKLKGADKTFIHTQHKNTEVDNDLLSENK